MISKDRVIQKNDSQKLADISLNKDKSNQLWSELSETSEAAVSGGSYVEWPNLPLTDKEVKKRIPSS